MEERLEAELALIRERYADVSCREEGRWVFIPSYPLPEGWNREVTEVAFQVSTGHPVAAPYGFYVPGGLLFNGNVLGSYTEPAENTPPFEGTWGFFSWGEEAATWKPATDVRSGANLLDWVNSFGRRFAEGA